MADVLEPAPIPAILRAPLGALLRGESAIWPAGARAEDAALFLKSIEEHGIAPLVYSRLSDTSWPIHTALREIAIPPPPANRCGSRTSARCSLSSRAWR